MAPQARQRYRKKAGQYITAVQLNLEFSRFVYTKWGAEQHCKPGDWLVENDGEVYTIDGATFSQTYERVRPGLYRKIASVWAEVADQHGSVRTQEGVSHYERGDYIVSNNEDGTDAYCIAAAKFESMYEREEGAA